MAIYNEDIKWLIKSIHQIMFRGGYSNIVTTQTLRKANLTPDERRMHRQVVYGVIENWLYLEAVLARFIKKNIERQLHIFLLAGLYELLCLDGRDHHAVVNRYVETAKRDFKGKEKFVNAILRRALREPLQLADLPLAEKLSLTYSFPLWLVRHWLDQYGTHKTQAILKQSHATKPLYLRVNLNKTTRQHVLAELRSATIVAIADPQLAKSIMVTDLNGQTITELASYQDGRVTIQDRSSMLVGEIVEKLAAQRILDMCSAPGGKAGDIAERLPNSQLVACDIHLHKLKLLESVKSRLSLDGLQIKESDAKCYNAAFDGQFDLVLLDAPCSGLGNIGHTPEIKYRKTAQDIKDLSRTQTEMLENARRYVKIGGNLLYSTCTIEKEENISQIDQFLKQNPNFKALEVSGLLPHPLVSDDYALQILPDGSWSDGFFIAVLTRHC